MDEVAFFEISHIQIAAAVLSLKIAANKGRLSVDHAIGLNRRIRLEGRISAPLNRLTVPEAQEAMRLCQLPTVAYYRDHGGGRRAPPCGNPALSNNILLMLRAVPAVLNAERAH